MTIKCSFPNIAQETGFAFGCAQWCFHYTNIKNCQKGLYVHIYYLVNHSPRSMKLCKKEIIWKATMHRNTFTLAINLLYIKSIFIVTSCKKTEKINCLAVVFCRSLLTSRNRLSVFLVTCIYFVNLWIITLTSFSFQHLSLVYVGFSIKITQFIFGYMSTLCWITE